MADMPYGSISGLTLWKILWTLYHYQVASHRDTASDGRERRGSVLMDRTDLDLIPENVSDIIQSIRGNIEYNMYMYMYSVILSIICTCTCTV